MKLFRTLAPFALGLVAVAQLSACDTTVSARTGYYSDRVWAGDPYCYDYDYYNSYGCPDYRYGGGVRIGLVFSRRHEGYRWRGRHHYDVTASVRPTTWQKEFHISKAAFRQIHGAFHSALQGDTSGLAALGVSRSDALRMSRFEMPSNASIAQAAGHLGMSTTDLRDFVDVYMVRLQTALAENAK